MRTIILYLLAMICATVALGAEFDPTRFPVANDSEARFREAWLNAPANPPASAEVFRALKGDPNLPADAVLWAIALYGTGEEVSAALLGVVNLAPSGPFYAAALGRLADEREAAGDFTSAKVYVEKLANAADTDKARAEALARLVVVSEKSGDEGGARRAAVELFTKYAHHAAADAGEAYLARGGGQPLEKITPDEVYKRGKTLLDSGSRTKAVEAFLYLRSGPRKTGEWPGLDLGLGKALHYLRRYEESLEPLSRAAKHSTDPETIQSAVFWKARSLFGLDRGNEGAPELVRLAKRYPSASKAPQWLFQAFRVYEGRALAKDAAAAKALLLKSYPASEEAVEVKLSEARALYNDGRYAEAAAKFERAVAQKQKGWTRAEGLFWAAKAFGKAGQEEKAKKAWARLLAEYPVGYYARAATACTAECTVNLWVEDARGKGGARLVAPSPGPADLTGTGEGETAARYLRLGMTEAARKVLAKADASGYAKLRYWAEDFGGALKASGADWAEWPVDEGSSGVKRLFFPLAYPSSMMVAAMESDVHPHLILAIAHTESHFDPDAYSPWEARGLMQFIPSTAKKTAEVLGMANFRDESLFEPQTALRLGARHLKELLDRFEGNMVSAIAAYNAGEQAVSKWRKEIKYADEAEFVERIPYKETRRYVKKVLTAIDAYGRTAGQGLWPLPAAQR